MLDFFELPAARDANSITFDLELQVTSLPDLTVHPQLITLP
jgi:hypothetical protein